MKKLTCVLLIVCLLCACGKKAQPSPAPVQEKPGEAEPAPESASQPEPESAPEPESPPEQAQIFEEGPPPDPDDPAPADSAEPAFEPVEVLSDFSPGQRTDLNVFLSNFSELDFPKFKRGDYDFGTLVNFAYMHNKINSFSRDKIDVRTYDGESCYSISAADVDVCLERFLGVQIDHRAFEMDSHSVGYDGERYYFLAADGEAFNSFSVAKSMVESDPGVYQVTFDVYNLDYEVYWDTGLEDKYYAMTPEQARSSGVLTRWCSGSAVLEDYDYNGRATWRLVSYEIEP